MSSPLAYDDVQGRNNTLIRKTLEGSLFIAPFSADAITTLTTGSSSGLTALPDDYEDCGWMTEDGMDIASAVTSVDISSFGSTEPTRTDITKRTFTVKATLQEMKAVNVGLVTFADPSGFTPDATTGEVDIPEAAVPSALYYRGLLLGVDLTDGGELYIARFFPRLKVTDVDDEKITNGSDAYDFGVTLTAFQDPALGYSSRRLFGGPGWKALNTAMGFSS